MKSIVEILFTIIFYMTASIGSLKFYQILEKDLAIKLAKGLPSLATFTDKLTATKSSKKHKQVASYGPETNDGKKTIITIEIAK
ncbi:MAG: hypothetical protein HQK49_13160 [Oligoflexia bacterium]|nr:hypothetical protein [Oligoflexia bacterium]